MQCVRWYRRPDRFYAATKWKNGVPPKQICLKRLWTNTAKISPTFGKTLWVPIEATYQLFLTLSHTECNILDAWRMIDTPQNTNFHLHFLSSCHGNRWKTSSNTITCGRPLIAMCNRSAWKLLRLNRNWSKFTFRTIRNQMRRFWIMHRSRPQQRALSWMEARMAMRMI